MRTVNDCPVFVCRRERSIGAATAARLRATTAPYILRREKKEVLPDRGDQSTSDPSPSSDDTSVDSSSSESSQPKPQGMGRKNDMICWLRLAPMQRCDTPNQLSNRQSYETNNLVF
jgi:hypothetical protein